MGGGGPCGEGGYWGVPRLCCPSPPPRAQGLERTEHEGFGGGNTAWEEEKLSKYQHRWVLPSRGGLRGSSCPGGRHPCADPPVPAVRPVC